MKKLSVGQPAPVSHANPVVRWVLRYVSTRVLVSFVVFSLLSVFFIWLAREVRGNETLGFDESFLWWVRGFGNTTLTTYVRWVTELGGVMFVPVFTLCIAGVFMWRRGVSYGLLILFGVMGSSLLNLLLKSIFTRQRPELWDRVVVEHSFSFPSGHAMASASLAASLIAALWYTRWRKLAISLGIAYVTAIAFTRLYLGVHYPTDILAGWAVSVAWVCLVFTVFARSPQSTPVTDKCHSQLD